MKVPPPRGFEPAEFQRRLDTVQRGMGEPGLDALLLTTEPDFRYLSGFLTRFWESPTRPWFLIVPAQGKPIAVIPEIGAPLMESTWVEEIHTWTSPSPADEGVSLLARHLAAFSRVGVPMGPETTLRMPLRDYQELKRSIPTTDFVDAGDVVSNARRVKSEAEIDKIRHICSVASDAFDHVPEVVAGSLPLSEVFRRFKITLLEAGADDVPYLVGASAPGGYPDVISPPDDRQVSRGDVLMMDTGAVFDGYFCDFDRNFAVGDADDETTKAYDTLFRATEAGIDALVVGARCAEVHDAMNRVIAASGYEVGNVGRAGHGLGMQLTEPPSFTTADQTILAEGMVMTLEPGLEISPGRGMVHEENLVVRASGPELLSRRAPTEIPVLSV